MRKLFTYLFIITLSFSSFAQKAVNTDSLIQYYKKKLEKYICKNDSLKDQYSIDKKGISLFASADKKKKDSAEFFLPWEKLSVFQNETRFFDSSFYKEVYCKNKMKTKIGTKKSHFSEVKVDYIFPPPPAIKGKKIALDPGHIGGTKKDAKRERKMVDIKKDSLNGIDDDDEIIEGNITMQTALLLKKKLESQGAIVLLTRNGEGENAFGYSFEDWMKKDLKKAVSKAYHENEINAKEKKKLLDPKTKPAYIFRYFFLQEELKQRAKKINAFHPDMTVVIHYNADENNLHGNKTGDKNFNMVFIPGAFMQNELETRLDRFEFLRLLVSNDIENSKAAADILLNSFVKTLNVPAASPNDASYLSEKCITTEMKGVYCRNLALTRFIHGTIIFGESLYQDNINEFKSLSEDETLIDGVMTNPRVAQVADAYYQALLQIFK